MKQGNKILTLVIAALLVATIFGLTRTQDQTSIPQGYRTKGASTLDQATQVDQAPLLTAQALAQTPNTPDEQEFAQDALGIADQEMDIAFAMALADVTAHPPAMSAEAKEVSARLQQAEDSLAAEQAQVQQLTAADGKATGAQQDKLDDQLQLAKATQELRQDEVDDAKQDLIRAGGDPQGRIQAMVQEHEAASQSSDMTKVNVANLAEARGLVNRFQTWWTLHRKQMQLWRAKEQADSLATSLSAAHESLEKQTNNREGQPNGASSPDATANASSASAGASPQDSAAKLKATKRRSADSRTLANLDKRISNEQELSGVYRNWAVVVAGLQREQVNRSLRGILIILIIALVALFVDGWLERIVSKTRMDRRQVETLRSTTRVCLQIVAVLFVLLVIFGPPTQLGTFLGLAGAGLTIALQDFIIAFIGWFILMGRSGIRIGDWVEINGVTGEVAELGIIHTVLLETGNWTDSGQPTGRRVTFTNSFAVQGHYFNFSTSGQWMWDQMQLVLPSSQNPYPLADALQKKVAELTGQIVQQAEQEWQHAAKSRDMHTLSAAPSINVKPVVGGTEISVRYITSAHQRSQLRSKLNQAAVDLLGVGHPTVQESPKPALTTN